MANSIAHHNLDRSRSSANFDRVLTIELQQVYVVVSYESQLAHCPDLLPVN
jgi:hypothetical protein